MKMPAREIEREEWFEYKRKQAKYSLIAFCIIAGFIIGTILISGILIKYGYIKN